MKKILFYSLLVILFSCKKQETQISYNDWEAEYTIGSDAPVTYIEQFQTYWIPVDTNKNQIVYVKKDSIQFDTTYNTGINYTFARFNNIKYVRHKVYAPGNNRLYITYVRSGQLQKIFVGKFNPDSNATYVEGEYTFK